MDVRPAVEMDSAAGVTSPTMALLTFIDISLRIGIFERARHRFPTTFSGISMSSPKKGDAIPVDLGKSKSFRADTEPLGLLMIGVARDMAAKNAFAASPANENPEW